uniref:Uncharacterized protein n=1 Tax=Panagrolaimus sp. JU765 TaxID=591449 RepID=A0AC34QYG5_9BILA
MEETKENLKTMINKTYVLEGVLIPKRVPCHIGPTVKSGCDLLPIWERPDYKEHVVNDILVKNKSYNYINLSSANEFDASHSINLPMLLRKCWQKEVTNEFDASHSINLPMLLRKCWQKEKKSIKAKSSKNGSSRPRPDSTSAPGSSSSTNTSAGPPRKIPRNS